TRRLHPRRDDRRAVGRPGTGRPDRRDTTAHERGPGRAPLRPIYVEALGGEVEIIASHRSCPRAKASAGRNRYVWQSISPVRHTVTSEADPRNEGERHESWDRQRESSSRILLSRRRMARDVGDQNVGRIGLPPSPFIRAIARIIVSPAIRWVCGQLTRSSLMKLSGGPYG